MRNDLIQELGTNFIEYAVAVNTDRAIPDAQSGLKPVAKRILYCTFDEGYSNSKPHVKCANIVGNVMAYWHPHGDSSIYGALVRLAQPWVMRYPLIDFHGSMGNRDGDGPAAYRYTEARLAKLAEDGMLGGIKKNNVEFTYNYDETRNEPITLPSLFPNLLCNPNTGIGVAMACNWLPHNLREVSNAIIDYIDGKEPTLPGPDFPTGGLIINGNDLPNIVKSGKGSVKVRGKYKMEDKNIVFYELPYGVATEALMNEIGTACDEGKIPGISNIRNESNRKNGFRLVIECEKNAPIATIINLLFRETSLQTSISYNQVALVDKTPTELTLKDCIKIYVDHNINCIITETKYDKQKAIDKLEILKGLLKALEDIDNIIALIKKSESAAAAKTELQAKYGFTEPQAKAIVDMKLGKLAGLERIEIQKEADGLVTIIDGLDLILTSPQAELRVRLSELVKKYGDDRRTEIIHLTESKEEKEIEFVEPEKCVVVMTEGGLIKRVPSSAYKTQRRNGKGIKSQDDITSAIIRTNTIDSLMIFSDRGKLYRLLVDEIPVGTNASKGVLINSLINLEQGEKASVIYSIYRDTDAKYVLFVSENGIIKKTPLEEYTKTKKKTGVNALSIREGDSLAAVSLLNDEDIILLTQKGYSIRFSASELSPASKAASGVKGINLGEGDKVVAALPVRDSNDDLALFTSNGLGKRVNLIEFVKQKRGGRGIVAMKFNGDATLVGGSLVNDNDNLLVLGDKSTICVEAKDISVLSRTSVGVQVLKGSGIKTVTKV
jgi:DNA gyrase subunit A